MDATITPISRSSPAGLPARSFEIPMTVHIKLYSGKGDRFMEIKSELTEQLGYEPSNPEVIGLLMAHHNQPKTRKAVK